MITIRLYQRLDSKDKSRGFIYVSFYINREKVHFSTKVECQAKHWNEEKMRILSAEENAADKNLILENIKARINNVIVKYRLRNKQLTRVGFHKAYNRPDDFDNFFAFVEDYKKTVSKTVELVTLNTHDSVIDKLKAFAPDLHFDDITLEFLTDFYSHLRKKIKNCENTAYKNMSVIRKYVKAAFKKGYMDENPFDDFSIIRTKPNYTYLDEEELRLLLKYYKEGDMDIKHYKTLQVFLFMCFGSQHIGDALQTKIEQFNNVSFTYFRKKNRNRKPEPVTVPVSEALRKILTDIVGNRKKGYIFEGLPAEQTMNRYLKEIATAAGIKKHITHKTGRHTFATFFLSKVPDLNTLREILGHSDIRETLIYAHVLEISKERGIQCFNTFEV